jgi:hypothetical protein
MNKRSNETKRRMLPWCRVTPWKLIVCLTMLSSAGCSTRLVVLPADKAVVRMPAGQPFTFTHDGWFVPDARMQEILKK